MAHRVLTLQNEVDESMAMGAQAELMAFDISMVYISSPGGDVHSANRIIDALDTLAGSPPIVATGHVASAAAYIFLSQPERLITPRTTMLFHPVRGGVWGTHLEVMAGGKYITDLQAMISETYIKAGLPQSYVDRAEREEVYILCADIIKMNIARPVTPKVR
jgi:ATP-dependent protease ClpP protease subunit